MGIIVYVMLLWNIHSRIVCTLHTHNSVTCHLQLYFSPGSKMYKLLAT